MVIVGNRMWKPMLSPNWTRDRISASSTRLIYIWMRREEREVQYRSRGWWADDTLAAWLARHACERPDAAAVVSQNRAWTWAELSVQVESVAGGLRARGIAGGDGGALGVVEAS